MATYPAFGCMTDSRRIIRDGRDEIVMGDGSARVAKTHADISDFELRHILTDADASTLTTFLQTYATDPAIDFVWPEDGLTYQVRLGKGAYTTRWVTNGYTEIKVRLVGVAGT